jgi:subtilisin family serine protease
MRNQWTLAAALILFTFGCGPGDLPVDGDDLDPGTSAQGLAGLRSGDPIPGRYVVVLENGADARAVGQEHARRAGGRLGHVYEHALKGYSIRLGESAARALARDPRVRYVEPDRVFEATVIQSPATWGLDRIDQRSLPLNQSYSYRDSGGGVNVYILDGGIRVTHSEFYPFRALESFTAINDGNGALDCDGHGTNVAATVGGVTWGVAKGAILHSVRVMQCGGAGYASDVIAGIDWVTFVQGYKAVANMSLGSNVPMQAVDDAVAGSIASGVTYVVSAGNANIDACNTSPARLPEAITVGATAAWDGRASFSNWGSCLDLFAPGVGITSAWHESDTAVTTYGGTSAAAPHVAGAAALYLSRLSLTAPAAQVRNELLNNSTPGKVLDAYPGSPNRLAYSVFVMPDPFLFMSNSVQVLSDRVVVTATFRNNSSSPATITGLSARGWTYGATVLGSSTCVTGNVLPAYSNCTVAVEGPRICGLVYSLGSMLSNAAKTTMGLPYGVPGPANCG